jgi:hypothetical protein
VDVAAGWESAVDLYRSKRTTAGAAAPTFTPSAPLPAELLATALRCTQREGDLLLIPPAMWHQTYHCGPTMAEAGQYMSAGNADGVYRHMLAWCGADADAVLGADGFASLGDAARVEAVLRAALRARHGADADALWAELQRSGEGAEEAEAAPARARPRRKRTPPGARRAAPAS